MKKHFFSKHLHFLLATLAITVGCGVVSLVILFFAEKQTTLFVTDQKILKLSEERAQTMTIYRSYKEKFHTFQALGVDTKGFEEKEASIAALLRREQFIEAQVAVLVLKAQLDTLYTDQVGVVPVKEFSLEQSIVSKKYIPPAPSVAGPVTQTHQYSSFARTTITTSRGNFSVDMITLDLSNPSLRFITDVAESGDCKNNCATKPLMNYVTENGAFAGINGTYFCPPEYASCAGSTGSFNTLVLDSPTKRFFNQAENVYSVNPLVVFDNGHRPHFYQHTYEYGTDTNIQAAMANHPLLIFGGQWVLNEDSLDSKSRTVKTNRGGIGVKGNSFYMIVAHGATVGDLAAIFQALGVEHAMNLDGGGSSALVYYGSYKTGPGRTIPNAFLVAQ